MLPSQIPLLQLGAQAPHFCCLGEGTDGGGGEGAEGRLLGAAGGVGLRPVEEGAGEVLGGVCGGLETLTCGAGGGKGRGKSKKALLVLTTLADVLVLNVEFNALVLKALHLRLLQKQRGGTDLAGTEEAFSPWRSSGSKGRSGGGKKGMYGRAFIQNNHACITLAPQA